MTKRPGTIPTKRKPVKDDEYDPRKDGESKREREWPGIPWPYEFGPSPEEDDA
jgi:hypothetical protein